MDKSILITGISIADFKVMMADLIEQTVSKRDYPGTDQPKELKQILTRKEAAAMLGGVSAPRLIEWSKTGYLKSFRMGRSVRYKRAVVQDFIDNRMKAAA